MAFSWDPTSRRYRDTESGKYIGMKRIRDLREGIVTANRDRVDALSTRLADCDLTVEQWTLEMRASIKAVTIDQYLLGRGGRNAMTPSDWGRIGYQLRGQYQYLQGFAHEIDAGNLSDAQIKVRAKLYIEATRSAFERAMGASWQIVLPAHPGDGSTECTVHCKCRWEIVETDEDIEATWVMDPDAEHCSTCRQRSYDWKPLVFPKGIPGISTPVAA